MAKRVVAMESEVSMAKKALQKLAELVQYIQLGNCEKILAIIHSNPAIINQQDDTGRTPLIHAAIQGQIEPIYVLLSHGADASIIDREKQTAFHYAARFNTAIVCRAFIENGISPELPNGIDVPPLSNAIAHHRLEVIRYLIEEVGCNTDFCVVAKDLDVLQWAIYCQEMAIGTDGQEDAWEVTRYFEKRYIHGKLAEIAQAGDRDTTLADQLAKILDREGVQELVAVVQSDDVEFIRAASIVLISNNLVYMLKNDGELSWSALDALLNAYHRTAGRYQAQVAEGISMVAMAWYPHERLEEFEQRLNDAITKNEEGNEALCETLEWANLP